MANWLLPRGAEPPIMALRATRFSPLERRSWDRSTLVGLNPLRPATGQGPLMAPAGRFPRGTLVPLSAARWWDGRRVRG
jgi:hypothetical protein